MEPNGLKRIFISDIHMGDDESVAPRYPYVWFKNNAPFLEKFLNEQLQAPDVGKVVILGDLFDEWNIPIDYDPLTSFQRICNNTTNKPVIAKLKALALGRKLVYVPGNHDMAMNSIGITQVKEFIEGTFSGIDFRCDTDRPVGKYEMGTLVAEHGNRYCLFNAPDIWTNYPASFLPLGYFVTRCVAYQSSKTGRCQTTPDMLSSFIKDWIRHPSTLVEDLLSAICADEEAGLTLQSTIKLDSVPGYDKGTLTVDDIKERFKNLYSDWDDKSPEAQQIQANMALINERDKLYEAAESAYFNTGSHNIVIFGHTHWAYLKGIPVADSIQSFNDDENVCLTIYANSGTWIDSAGEGGTYVETEELEAHDGKRFYVRLKQYNGAGAAIKDWGFVKQ